MPQRVMRCGVGLIPDRNLRGARRIRVAPDDAAHDMPITQRCADDARRAHCATCHARRDAGGNRPGEPAGSRTCGSTMEYVNLYDINEKIILYYIYIYILDVSCARDGGCVCRESRGAERARPAGAGAHAPAHRAAMPVPTSPRAMRDGDHASSRGMAWHRRGVMGYHRGMTRPSRGSEGGAAAGCAAHGELARRGVLRGIKCILPDHGMRFSFRWGKGPLRQIGQSELTMHNLTIYRC